METLADETDCSDAIQNLLNWKRMRRYDGDLETNKYVERIIVVTKTFSTFYYCSEKDVWEKWKNVPNMTKNSELAMLANILYVFDKIHQHRFVYD